MRTYLLMYRWAMGMKPRMGLYTVGLVFFKAIWNMTQSVWSVDILDLGTMWAAAFAFALVESAIFPEGLDAHQHPLRTVLWAAAGNAAFLGGALGFGWFRGVPLWAAAALVVVLELGLFSMWFGTHVVMRADSAQLNQSLRRFQAARDDQDTVR